MMGLGPVKAFNLKEARDRARSARQLLADGIDPLVTKQAARAAAKLAAAKAMTFREAAQRYFDQHEKKWTNASHRDQFLASLKSYAFDHIGNMDVAAINLPDVLRCIEPHWTTTSITMDRVRNRIEGVLDWCVVRGHRPPGTNPAKWKGHLDQVLPAARKVAPIKEHAAIDYRDVPAAFMAALRKDESVAARALEYLILTAARTGEVLGATWGEINVAEAMWTIPANRMKAKREHRVPLSPAAIALLRKLPREPNNPHVFIGSQPGRGFSRIALGGIMQRLERSETVHGFRSSFRTWAAEQTNYPRDVWERALAHIVGNRTERAYERTDLFDKRRKLMESWSKYVTSPPAKPGAVIPIRKGR
jgi:integrase